MGRTDELASTTRDYARFGQMMLDKGRFGNERILSRLSVETMTVDHMTPEQKAASPFFPGFWDNRGWGFGVVDSHPPGRHRLRARPLRMGRWYGDLMVRRPHREPARHPDDPGGACFPSGIYEDFWTSVYQAIDD